jgi:hypothetical protein
VRVCLWTLISVTTRIISHGFINMLWLWRFWTSLRFCWKNKVFRYNSICFIRPILNYFFKGISQFKKYFAFSTVPLKSSHYKNVCIQYLPTLDNHPIQFNRALLIDSCHFRLCTSECISFKGGFFPFELIS